MLGRYFDHDCLVCTQLGQYKGCDLYYCVEEDIVLISRFGDEGSEYTSIPLYIVESGNFDDKYIAEAYRRYKDL